MTSDSPIQASPPPASPIRTRLDFIDGMRATAALYVALTHAYNYSGMPNNPEDIPAWVRAASSWLGYGHYAVDVFIVLSGFCLMLPIITSQDRSLRGGFRGYLMRRSRRILPAYYASVLLTLGLILLIPALNHPTGGAWDVALPATTPDVLASHAFLYHNLSPDWAYKINGALWSIATEWQIYFAFPLLLLLWRVGGLLPALALAFAVGYAAHFLPDGRFDAAAPWYLGLFALGMAAAAIGFADTGTEMPHRMRFPWGSVAILFCIPVLAASYLPAVWMRKLWAIDAVIGAATACFLIYGSRDYLFGKPPVPPTIRYLLHPRTVWLGEISYSIYLVHVPVIVLMDLALQNVSMATPVRLLVYLMLSLPLTVAIAYPFHLLFERPFLSKRYRLP